MSESWEPNSSASISSAGAIPARRIAEPASRAARGRRLLALNSSAWLRRVAQGLFSERIRHASAQMRLGLGGDSDRSSNVWDTWCCPSDSEPVALARTTSGIGCSCLARMPTPTASVFGCADVPRMLARRQRCKESHGNGNGFGLTFSQWVAVKLWTPTASDWRGSTGKGCRRNTLAEQLAVEDGRHDGKTVYPHPEYVEAVMGFPITWTAFEDSGTRSIRRRRNGSAVRSSRPTPP